MSGVNVIGKFIESSAGKIIVLLRRPAVSQDDCPCVLIVPPFAEEMNKSRRVFYDVAAKAVERGMACVLVDLYGTGDSEGNFGDTCWETWQTDVLNAIRWSQEQGVRVDRLLALRLGCLLAASTIKRFQLEFKKSVFWQPVLKGSLAITQLLRTRVAASMMDGSKRDSMSAIQARLKSGRSVEAAGYWIGARLAQQLNEQELSACLTSGLGKLAWFEISHSSGKSFSQPASKVIETARKRGIVVYPEQVEGEPFWSSVEIVRNMELAERTTVELADVQ